MRLCCFFLCVCVFWGGGFVLCSLFSLSSHKPCSLTSAFSINTTVQTGTEIPPLLRKTDSFKRHATAILHDHAAEQYRQIIILMYPYIHFLYCLFVRGWPWSLFQLWACGPVQPGLVVSQSQGSYRQANIHTIGQFRLVFNSP